MYSQSHYANKTERQSTRSKNLAADGNPEKHKDHFASTEGIPGNEAPCWRHRQHHSVAPLLPFPVPVCWMEKGDTFWC